MLVFAKNFRGFKNVEIDLEKITFLVGDNSSGKSSILHLVNSIFNSSLDTPPKLDEDFGVSQYDYFSPYTNYEDVTFGYISDHDGSKFAKLITVTRGKDTPSVISCTYAMKNFAVTLKKGSGPAYRTRIIKKDISFASSDLISLHASPEGFYPGGRYNKMLAEPSFLFAEKKLEDGLKDQLIERMFDREVAQARLVSPIRALPEKFYNFSRKLTAGGLHFATMWHDFEKLKKFNWLDDVEKFGNESSLFESIKVSKISTKISDSPLLATVTKNGKQFNLNQVGVGVSQVVPVLVESAFALLSKPKSVVLIQQPELHLHPVAQAAFGSYLYRSGIRGLRGVFETHSSFLIDRFRAEIHEAEMESKEKSFHYKDAVILFCENTVDGNISTNVDILENGQLGDAPDAFHGFFVNELLRTMF